MSDSNKGSDWAFPLAANEWAGHGPVRGMTLRDYFAAKAMQAMVANNWPIIAEDGDTLAIVAYKVADKMLAERAK